MMAGVGDGDGFVHFSSGGGITIMIFVFKITPRL